MANPMVISTAIEESGKAILFPLSFFVWLKMS
jgi:hypothetical protein